jgi:hypothetical protein
LNTTTNLGTSIGTAVIGVLLIVSVYAALGPAVQRAYPNQVTAQDVKEKLPAWVDTLKTTNLQVVKAEQNTTTQIVDETISASMQHAIDGISVFLFAGFLVSLFIGRPRRPAPTH